MKRIFILFAFSLFLYSSAFSLANEEKPIKINVHISDKIAQTSQWVYWFSLVGNNYCVEDSIFVHKNQKEFTFEKKINKDRGFYYTWLTFEKEGPSQNVVFGVPGENIKLSINSSLNNEAKIEGSVFHKEDFENKQLIKEIRDSLECLEDSLILSSDNNTQVSLEHKIEDINNYISTDSYLDFLLRAKSPISTIFYYDLLQLKKPSADFDSLKQVIASRFPNNKIVDQYFNYEKQPPETEKSKKVYKRYLQLVGLSNSPDERKTQKEKLEDIEPYGIGDKVDLISLEGVDGNIINLQDIKKDYILIDFWAAWCAPCRKEVPYLKEVIDKHSELITIYAISFDNSEEEWKRAISNDKSSEFTHVYAGIDTAEASVLHTRFGIKGIPANFLLDKNRKIIAVDLRKDDLMKYMDNLSL